MCRFSFSIWVKFVSLQHVFYFVTYLHNKPTSERMFDVNTIDMRSYLPFQQFLCQKRKHRKKEEEEVQLNTSPANDSSQSSVHMLFRRHRQRLHLLLRERFAICLSICFLNARFACAHFMLTIRFTPFLLFHRFRYLQREFFHCRCLCESVCVCVFENEN